MQSTLWSCKKLVGCHAHTIYIYIYIYIAFNFVDLIKVPLTFTVYGTASVCFLHHSTLLSYVQFKNHIYEQADQS